MLPLIPWQTSEGYDVRLTITLVLGLYFVFQAAPDIHAQRLVSSVILPPVVPSPTVTGDDNYHPGALRRGGSFRSPRSGFTPGYGNGRTGRAPGATTPAPPRSRFGGFMGGLFGGLVAGSLFSSLFNPLGFGGGGISILGLLFWGVIIYLVVRFFRRRSGNRY
jgi:uncharacterized membrane protein